MKIINQTASQSVPKKTSEINVQQLDIEPFDAHNNNTQVKEIIHDESNDEKEEPGIY